MLSNIGFHRPYQANQNLSFGKITVKSDYFKYSDPYTGKTHPEVLRKMQKAHDNLSERSDIEVSPIRQEDNYIKEHQIILPFEKSDVLLSDHKQPEERTSSARKLCESGVKKLKYDQEITGEDGTPYRIIYGNFFKKYTCHKFDIKAVDEYKEKQGTNARKRELLSYVRIEEGIKRNLREELDEDCKISLRYPDELINHVGNNE